MAAIAGFFPGADLEKPRNRTLMGAATGLDSLRIRPGTIGLSRHTVETPLMGIYLLGWLPMIVIAIANAAIREIGYAKYFSERHAHQISTLTGAIFLGIYMGWFVGAWPPASLTQATAVGALWLGLTVAFEFGFGRYVLKHSWRRLRQDYNLQAGRVWGLLLLWIAIAPAVFYALQR